MLVHGALQLYNQAKSDRMAEFLQVWTTWKEASVVLNVHFELPFMHHFADWNSLEMQRERRERSRRRGECNMYTWRLLLDIKEERVIQLSFSITVTLSFHYWDKCRRNRSKQWKKTKRRSCCSPLLRSKLFCWRTARKATWTCKYIQDKFCQMKITEIFRFSSLVPVDGNSILTPIHLILMLSLL